MIRLFFIYISLALFAHLHAEIIEVGHFQEITEYLDSETLVILDIDDTLLVPIQTLGTDPWFLSRLEYHWHITNDRSRALDKALAEWEAVRHLTDVKLVEAKTDEIIDNMQRNNIVVMGLTTQGLSLSDRTPVQLQSLSINLSKSAPSSQDCYFINGARGVLYHHGILFTSGTSKGEALLQLLDLIDYHPKKIVFINDKKTHLQDVEKSATSRNINFVGLRYSYSDERVANFSPEIADAQWKYSSFDHLLSDEEALDFMK